MISLLYKNFNILTKVQCVELPSNVRKTFLPNMRSKKYFFYYLKNKFILITLIFYFCVRQSLVASYVRILIFFKDIHKKKEIVSSVTTCDNCYSLITFQLMLLLQRFFASFSAMTNSGLLLNWSSVSPILSMLSGLLTILLLFNILLTAWKRMLC